MRAALACAIFLAGCAAPAGDWHSNCPGLTDEPTFFIAHWRAPGLLHLFNSTPPEWTRAPAPPGFGAAWLPARANVTLLVPQDMAVGSLRITVEGLEGTFHQETNVAPNRAAVRVLLGRLLPSDEANATTDVFMATMREEPIPVEGWHPLHSTPLPHAAVERALAQAGAEESRLEESVGTGWRQGPDWWVQWRLDVVERSGGLVRAIDASGLGLASGMGQSVDTFAADVLAELGSLGVASEPEGFNVSLAPRPTC